MAWHFSNSRLWGTKSNAFENSINITSVGLDLFQSSKQHSSWVRIDFPLRKPNLTTQSLTTFSLTLHAMEVSEIWREFLLQSFLPFLWTGTMLAIFHSYVTSPAKNDLFRSELKIGAILIAHSFNTRGLRWSGHGNLCGFRKSSNVNTAYSLERIRNGFNMIPHSNQHTSSLESIRLSVPSKNQIIGSLLNYLR